MYRNSTACFLHNLLFTLKFKTATVDSVGTSTSTTAAASAEPNNAVNDVAEKKNESDTNGDDKHQPVTTVTETMEEERKTTLTVGKIAVESKDKDDIMLADKEESSQSSMSANGPEHSSFDSTEMVNDTTPTANQDVEMMEEETSTKVDRSQGGDMLTTTTSNSDAVDEKDNNGEDKKEENKNAKTTSEKNDEEASSSSKEQESTSSSSEKKDEVSSEGGSNANNSPTTTTTENSVNDTRRRVKLYMLNQNRTWDDRGTGHVTSPYCEDKNTTLLLVKSEADGSTLLESAIQLDTAYQKQQDTLIVWSDNNYELALSFQERAGCDEIWNKICEVQHRDPSNDFTQEPTEDDENGKFDFELNSCLNICYSE